MSIHFSKFRESKVKKWSMRICVAASAAVACSAFAQDIKVGEGPDLVIGAVSKKAAAPAPLAAPMAVVPVASPVPASSAQTWRVDIKDVTLANTFQRWASVAGWRVRWDAAQNVMVDAPDSFSGSFEDAVAAQLSSPGIAYSAYPLEVCFYPNTPPLARVTRKGEQIKECK